MQRPVWYNKENQIRKAETHLRKKVEDNGRNF